MRRFSASTRGRSGARSMRMLDRAPSLRKVLRASSTMSATTVGWGSTASVPISIWATSRRSLMRERM